MTNRSVRLAAAQIEPSPNLTLTGFVLIFSQEEALDEFIAGVQAYFTERTWSDHLLVKLRNNGDLVSFLLELRAAEHRTRVSIDNVDRNLISLAQDFLAEQRYYFILTAVGTSDEFEPRFTEGSYFFRSEMQLNDSISYCNQKGKWTSTPDPFKMT
jgi:hypothetical protein